jgi:hypothetical protein
MMNILDQLIYAKENYQAAQTEDIHNFENFISSLNIGIEYDWDEWSGEEWCSIMTDSERVAIICIKIPIVFISEKYKRKLSDCDLMKKMHIVGVPDFDEVIWSLDLSEYKESNLELEWHVSEDAVNPRAFSTSDFWFATI